MNIGIGEILVIAAVALVVIGPEKFPDFAKIVIRTVRDIRGYVNEAKSDIAREFKPVKKEFNELSRYEPEKYIETLSKGVFEEAEPAKTSEPGTDRSQPVAPAAEDTTSSEEPGAATTGTEAPVDEADDPYADRKEPGTQTYGGSNYSAARQGDKYEGPERIDG